MSGYELCRALRQNHGEGLPLFLMSGDRTDSMDRVAGLLIGADDYIVKPFNVDELVARVAPVRRAARAGRATAHRRPAWT